MLLDGALQQIRLAAANRRLARHFRIGPAQRALDDPSYIYEVHAFDGIGLRPYSPVHLTVTRSGADLLVRWIRRTRIDGDGWDLDEVPLSEESERYLIRVIQGRGDFTGGTDQQPGLGLYCRDAGGGRRHWILSHHRGASFGALWARTLRVCHGLAMRPVLHSDLIFAARALLESPADVRASAADRLLARADAADRYRRRKGRSHPDWGNGTLMALAAKTALPPTPDLRDPEFAACLGAMLVALMRFSGGARRSG